MSFQFQLLTQLESIHKNVKQEDIDRDKIRKWVLLKLKENPQTQEAHLKDLGKLFDKFFHELLEVINEFKQKPPAQIKQEIEEAFGTDTSSITVTVKEASNIAGKTERTISRWVTEGKIRRAPNKRIFLESLHKHIGLRQ